MGMKLNDGIVVKFQMDPESLTNGTHVEVTVGSGYSYTVPVSDITASENVLSVPVFATQMTDAITLCLVSGDSRSEENSFTVLEYCQRLLDDPEYASYHALVKELLNYGRKAQEHFEYNLDEKIADDLIADAGQTGVPTDVEVPYAIQDESTALNCIGATLVCRDRIALRFYLTEDQEHSEKGLGGCTFTVNGEATSVTVKDGYVEIHDILPQNLDEQVVLSVTDEDNHVVSITYSPMTYIVRMSQKGSDTTKALVKALYNYHLAAKAYVP
jgi:hypothetical protein